VSLWQHLKDAALKARFCVQVLLRQCPTTVDTISTTVDTISTTVDTISTTVGTISTTGDTISTTQLSYLISVRNSRATAVILVQGKQKERSMWLPYEYQILISIQVGKIQILAGRLEKITDQVSVSEFTHICPLCNGCADFPTLYKSVLNCIGHISRPAMLFCQYGQQANMKPNIMVWWLPVVLRVLKSACSNLFSEIDYCWVFHGVPQPLSLCKRAIKHVGILVSVYLLPITRRKLQEGTDQILHVT
jgi:hypothetical protein